MSDLARGFEFIHSRQSSFLKRIRENLESVCALPQLPLSAEYAPIHLLDDRRERAYAKAQFGSTCLHALVFGLLILGMLRPPGIDQKNTLQKRATLGPLEFQEPNWLRQVDIGTSGKSGNGGGHDMLPPTAGELPPPSRVALMPPRLPDGRTHELVVPVTIADSDPPEINQVNDPGLPWMKDKNNSEGSGEHGIGMGSNHGMGDGPGDGSGVGNDAGPYANVVTQVVCRVCPDPLYSDEARKAKLQGRVTMRVRVGADGRVRDIQVTRGIGLGLDENATRAVRSWQFVPARDAGGRPVATWITIETVFRLF
jgi:protein TonB